VASRGEYEMVGRWSIRSLRCYEEGLALRGVVLQPTVHSLNGDRSAAILFEMLVAAVCHSTNWDRLRGHFEKLARSTNFEAEALSRVTLPQFMQLAAGGFDEAIDLVPRYEMFSSVAHELARPGSQLRPETLINRAQPLSGESGLYERLDTLPVFSADPQRKKARILVQQLRRHRLVDFIDPENIRPAIEYHIIRLYLRTQRVIHSDGLEFGLDTERAGDIRSVSALREAVESAMYYTASGAEMQIHDVNEIEWQIARSYCARERPQCFGPPLTTKPVDEAIASIANGACPFSSTCEGPQTSRVSRLAEPRLSDRHAFY
jgi:hypothetical protein